MKSRWLSSSRKDIDGNWYISSEEHIYLVEGPKFDVLARLFKATGKLELDITIPPEASPVGHDDGILRLPKIERWWADTITDRALISRIVLGGEKDIQALLAFRRCV